MPDMRFKSGVTVVLLAGVIAGCGGGEKKPSAPKPDAAQADAAAKTAARTAATEMEACFVDAASYADCKPASRGVQVSDATASGYKLTSKSTAGNSFVLTKTDAGIERTCTTEGEGGCGADGTW